MASFPPPVDPTDPQGLRAAQAAQGGLRRFRPSPRRRPRIFQSLVDRARATRDPRRMPQTDPNLQSAEGNFMPPPRPAPAPIMPDPDQSVAPPMPPGPPQVDPMPSRMPAPRPGGPYGGIEAGRRRPSGNIFGSDAFGGWGG